MLTPAMVVRRHWPLCKHCGCQLQRSPNRDGLECASPVCDYFLPSIRFYRPPLRLRLLARLRGAK